MNMATLSWTLDYPVATIKTYKICMVDYLRSLELTGMRQIYQRITVVLVLCGLDKAIFPKRIFTTSSGLDRPRKGYSQKERTSILKALNTEVSGVLQASEQLTSSKLGYLVAWIIIRTGLNRQPVVEMPTDAIRPHPFHAQKKLLVTYKRRGNSIHVHSFTPQRAIESIREVAPQLDVVISHTLTYTSAAREDTEFPNRLFLYIGISGKGTPITAAIIDGAMNSLVKNYNLLQDDGTPLRLNMSRLRTTWINRVYELTGFDSYLTAALAGHKNIKVTNDVYLEPPENAELEHAFMGEVNFPFLMAGPT